MPLSSDFRLASPLEKALPLDCPSEVPLLDWWLVQDAFFRPDPFLAVFLPLIFLSLFLCGLGFVLLLAAVPFVFVVI